MLANSCYVSSALSWCFLLLSLLHLISWNIGLHGCCDFLVRNLGSRSSCSHGVLFDCQLDRENCPDFYIPEASCILLGSLWFNPSSTCTTSGLSLLQRAILCTFLMFQTYFYCSPFPAHSELLPLGLQLFIWAFLRDSFCLFPLFYHLPIFLHLCFICAAPWSFLLPPALCSSPVCPLHLLPSLLSPSLSSSCAVVACPGLL